MGNERLGSNRDQKQEDKANFADPPEPGIPSYADRWIGDQVRQLQKAYSFDEIKAMVEAFKYSSERDREIDVAKILSPFMWELERCDAPYFELPVEVWQQLEAITDKGSHLRKWTNAKGDIIEITCKGHRRFTFYEASRELVQLLDESKVEKDEADLQFLATLKSALAIYERSKFSFQRELEKIK